MKKAEKEDVPSPKPTVEKVESETPSEPSPNAEEASEPELAEARPYLGQMMEESLSSALNSEFGLQDLRIIVHTIRKLSAAEIKSDEVSSFEHASSDTLSRNVLSAPNFSLSSGKAATHIAFPAIVGLALIATVLIRVFAD